MNIFNLPSVREEFSRGMSRAITAGDRTPAVILHFRTNSGWFILPKWLWFRSVLMPWFWLICPRAPRQWSVGVQVSLKRRNIWGIQEITCGKSSFLSHGRTRHSRGWGTLAPGSCRGLGGGTNRKENWNGSVNKTIDISACLIMKGHYWGFVLRWLILSLLICEHL